MLNEIIMTWLVGVDNGDLKWDLEMVPEKEMIPVLWIAIDDWSTYWH